MTEACSANYIPLLHLLGLVRDGARAKSYWCKCKQELNNVQGNVGNPNVKMDQHDDKRTATSTQNKSWTRIIKFTLYFQRCSFPFLAHRVEKRLTDPFLLDFPTGRADCNLRAQEKRVMGSHLISVLF